MICRHAGLLQSRARGCLSGQAAQGRSLPGILERFDSQGMRGIGTRQRCAHEVLGVAPSASEDVVKAAFRKLARKCHPDVVETAKQESAAEEFKELESAYSTLMGRSTASEGDADYKYEAPIKEITFQPGNPGVVATLQGRVVEVNLGGLYCLAGVEAGWVISTVDGQAYTQQLLVDRVNGKVDYTVAFQKLTATDTPGDVFDFAWWRFNNGGLGFGFFGGGFVVAVLFGLVIPDMFSENGALGHMMAEQRLLDSGGWCCQKCTFVNKADVDSCKHCLTGREQ